jgi:hypothetical protein
MISLGSVFIISRKEDIATELQKRLVWVFVGHSSICTGMLIKELGVVSNINSKMGFETVLMKLVAILGVFQVFLGALIGASALRVSNVVPGEERRFQEA